MPRAPAASLASLVLVAFLAGCAGSPSGDPGTDDASNPGRTARPGERAPDLDPDVPLAGEAFLSAPLRMLGPGSAYYPAEVPANLTMVTFVIRGTQTAQFHDLRVELSGCGSHRNVGVFGSTGSTVEYHSDLCGEPEAGPATATVEAAAAVVEGTFELVGWRPAPGSG